MPSRPAQLNILCVDQYAELGGAQRTLLDLLPSFRQRGWTIQAVLPGHGGSRSPFESALDNLDCPTYSYRASSYTKVKKRASEMITYLGECPRLARVITRAVRERAIDVIYVNGPRALAAAAWVARRRSLPLVFHCHNRLHQSTAIQLAGQSLRFSSGHIIACCQFAAEPLIPFVHPKRFRVLYNGVAPSGIRSVSMGTHPVVRIGVVGRIEEEKGQLEFVRAARILHRHFADLQFSIVGAPLFADGSYMERVRAEAADLPITFTGWREDVGEIFAGLDLLIVPSSHLDATPRVILEAQERQTPVVAFAVGGIPEIIRDGETGFLVYQQTPAALAHKIASILKSGWEQLDRVRERAAEACRDTYSLANYRRNVADFLQSAGRVA